MGDDDLFSVPKFYLWISSFGSLLIIASCGTS